ncbi:MAG: NAD(+) diphosphatase [Azoarcus sp.]|jgi:NAD+ diphosphatase|nr:NAD(+) diphosphatase [Azoarcus sp.]
MTAAVPDFEPAYGLVDPPDAEDGHALVFPFIGQKLLIGPGATLPRQPLPRSLGQPLRAFRFGILGGRDCVMRVWPTDIAIPSEYTIGDYRSLWGQWPPGQLAAFARARQLAAWVLHNRFCGACGQAMEPARAETACECPACGHKAYPRISPVAIGVILKGDEILLARSPHFVPGMYSALAGFVEAGESAEDCLRREIREEAGIDIHNIRYFGSQSWPYPHSLMLGFTADYLGGNLVAQEAEIEDLGWFRFDSLPVLPHGGSLARRMIDAVCKTLAEKTRRP